MRDLNKVFYKIAVIAGLTIWVIPFLVAALFGLLLLVPFWLVPKSIKVKNLKRKFKVYRGLFGKKILTFAHFIDAYLFKI